MYVGQEVHPDDRVHDRVEHRSHSGLQRIYCRQGLAQDGGAGEDEDAQGGARHVQCRLPHHLEPETLDPRVHLPPPITLFLLMSLSGWGPADIQAAFCPPHIACCISKVVAEVMSLAVLL